MDYAMIIILLLLLILLLFVLLRLSRTERELAALQQGQEKDALIRRQELFGMVQELGGDLRQELAASGERQERRMEAFSQRFVAQSLADEERMDQLNRNVADSLSRLREENSSRMAEMNRSIDGRLGESFAAMAARLEELHRGLGEMKELAGGVDDLKKLMRNIKTRGIWGEMQLSALLEQILSPGQYVQNARIRPDRDERVEFAVRIPNAGQELLLPIDAKFPLSAYERLLAAEEAQDAAATAAASAELEAALRREARSISEKYIAPPYSTDFALLFLPLEGLYAEALRRPGLTDELQRKYRVALAGPSTLAALLSSLRMGFRTLAVQEQASQIWQLLGEVSGEFHKFGEAIAHSQKKLTEASHSLDMAARRQRVLSQRLEKVDELSAIKEENDAGMETDLLER